MDLPTSNPYLLTLVMFLAIQFYGKAGDVIFGSISSSTELHELVIEKPLRRLVPSLGGSILCEELFFRLFLVGLLGLHVWWGFIPISVGAFALCHLPNVHSGRGQRSRLLLGQLLNGAFLTWVFLSSGFFAVLLCHALFNALIVAGARLHYRLRPAKLAEARAGVYGSAAGLRPLPSTESWTLPAVGEPAGPA